DDGKSTLVGRLLHDSKSVLADTLEAVERASRDRGADGVELALLTDGLRAEREQGITIDVAYRYFTTTRRKFVLADTPGHVQYTRNMVTGASTAELVVILVDARKGVVDASSSMPWYAGPTLLDHLEAVPVGIDAWMQPARLPIQLVVRAADYRGYAGQLASGVIEKGDVVVVMPAGVTTTIVGIDTFD